MHLDQLTPSSLCIYIHSTAWKTESRRNVHRGPGAASTGRQAQSPQERGVLRPRHDRLRAPGLYRGGRRGALKDTNE